MIIHFAENAKTVADGLILLLVQLQWLGLGLFALRPLLQLADQLLD
ncbi:MAG: hypothetical protein HZT40_14465 [Candidatus Thiothrix singaporensis]|uniref:Uncharacterized protein n=1 Tax=Candidatus Thiothrix singaporensis TaxID=2799669 RepID=A0A7L6AUG5_9GAMM|nr:MAG: hypothetical protein HZT40_14465 [Candidatus Thiothrix singaporensis]